jgi:hypothetical protein
MTADEASAVGETIAPLMDGAMAHLVGLLTAASAVARQSPPSPVALLKLLQATSAAAEAAVHATEAAITLLTEGPCPHPETSRSYARATMGGPDVWDCQECGYAHQGESAPAPEA